MRLLPSLLALPLLAGCPNACENLCVNYADYATECGRNVSDAEVDACLDDWSAPSRVDLQTCQQVGTPDLLRREWTCDDVLQFWGDDGGGAGNDG